MRTPPKMDLFSFSSDMKSLVTVERQTFFGQVEEPIVVGPFPSPPPPSPLPPPFSFFAISELYSGGWSLMGLLNRTFHPSSI